MANAAGQKRPTVSADEGNVFRTVAHLWPYMWPADRADLRWRVVLALAALLVSKAATTFVPFAYKGIIVSLGTTGENAALILGIAVPVVLVIAYGVGNILDAGFQ